jgi:hypothetical protein
MEEVGRNHKKWIWPTIMWTKTKDRWYRNYFVTVYRTGKEAVAKKQQEEQLKLYRDKIKEMFCSRGHKQVNVYGGDYSWSPVHVYLNGCSLHEARQIMRLMLGKWEDKAEPGGCEEEGWGDDKKHMLTVYYTPPQLEAMKYPTKLVMKYDINDLPPGLLKEGCEIIREQKVTVSCSVRCAA